MPFRINVNVRLLRSWGKDIDNVMMDDHGAEGPTRVGGLDV